MKAILKLIPVKFSELVMSRPVVYQNELFEVTGFTNALLTKTDSGRKPKISSMERQKEIVNPDEKELKQIVCEYQYYDGMSQTNDSYVTKQIPLSPNDYKYAMDKIGKEVEVLDNPILACVINKSETWDDIRKEYAKYIHETGDVRMHEFKFLKENYQAPKRK